MTHLKTMPTAEFTHRERLILLVKKWELFGSDRVAQFDVPSQILPGGTEESHQKHNRDDLTPDLVLEPRTLFQETGLSSPDRYIYPTFVLCCCCRYINFRWCCFLLLLLWHIEPLPSNYQETNN
jgi:hypothetical protein